MPLAAARSGVTMFGLDLHASEATPAFPATDLTPTGRRLDLDFDPQAPERLGFPPGARTISEERRRDGGLVFQIEQDEEAGYLIWGPRYGANLLRPDGGSALSRPGEGGYKAWLRLLLAQLLPFAAVLQGLETLHASGVLIGDRAIVLAGRGGAGKSATAAALRRLGAVFLADDVVALERHEGGLIAHPGPPFEAVEGRDEDLVAAGPLGTPAEVGALFFLDRRRDGPEEPCFEPVLDPRLLIASTFNAVLRSPARLQAQLEICAEIATRRVERVAAASDLDPDRLAEAIADRIGG